MLRELLRRVWYLLNRGRRDDELRQDMEAHLAMMDNPGRFGSALRLREQARDTWGARWIDEWHQDVVFAVRGLRRSPGFAAVAVGTLALGIGANAAMFNVVYEALLKPLPYHRADELVVVSSIVPQFQARFPVLAVPAADFVEYRRSNDVLAEMAALQGTAFSLTGEGEPQRLDGARVSANFFSMVGVSAASGRTFHPSEDEAGNDRVIVISHDLWKARFAADPGIVGRTLTLDGLPFTVVGVMPDGFLFPTGKQMQSLAVFGPRVDVWKPMGFTPAQLRSEGSFDYAVIARLKPAVSIEQAQHNLDAVAQNNVQRIKKQAPTIDYDLRTQLVPLRRMLSGNVRQPLLMLLAAVGLLLVVACVNLANLVLARTTRRAREFATRAALGASRGRLIRQLFAEGLVVAVFGAAAGAAVAVWCGRLLIWLAPVGAVPEHTGGWEFPVVGFVVGVTLAVGTALGLLPAFEGLRRDLHARLRTVSQTVIGGGRRWIRSGLVSVQVAVSVALVAVAGLLLQSFVNVMRADKGFAAERRLAADLSLPAAVYPRPRIAEFFGLLISRTQSIPGVTSVGAVNLLPLAHEGNWRSVLLESETEERLARPTMNRSVAGDFFDAMGIPLLGGRPFAENESTPVAIVSAGLARALWPSDVPLAVVGRRIRIGETRSPLTTVVGVAGDVRAAGLDREAPLAVYRPLSQMPFTEMTLVVRTALNPESIGGALRAGVSDLDPNLPIAAMRTMESVVTASVAPRRFQLLLIMVLGGLALALAIVGIYGVTSYLVAGRTREIGIRIALGARPAAVVCSVLSQGLQPVAIGLLVGLLGAALAGVAIRATLFGVAPLAPIVFVAVTALLGMAGTLACYLPARRAGHVDPAVTLRCE